MKLSKILGGASFAALLAGNAHALDLQPSTFGGFTAPDITTFVTVAEEANLSAGTQAQGNYGISLTTTGTYAANENYLVTLTLSGGTFTSALTGAEVLTGNGSDGVATPITGASVQGTTGQAGSTTVTYLVSTGPTASGEIDFELPITYSGCTSGLDITATVTLTDGTTQLEEGTTTLSTDNSNQGPIVQCANAYQATLASDVTVPANDSILAGVLFQNYIPGATTVLLDAGATGAPAAGAVDTALVATHGTVAVSFTPGSAATSLLTSLDGSTPPVTGAAGELASVDFDVQLANTTGVTNIDTVAGGANPAPAFVGNVASFVDTAVAALVLTAADYVEGIQITVPAGAPSIQAQPVQTANGLLQFAALGLVANEPFADATLDDLNFEGQLCATFDWVGDETKPTKNIWRVTGLGATTLDLVVTLANATIPSFNGTYTIAVPTVAGTDFTDDEFIINERDITAAAGGNFGRADVSFNFIGASTGLDCDRLMNSDAQNIITPFGNNNQQETAPVAGANQGDD